MERERYRGIGTMTTLLLNTVHLVHRRAIELEEAHRKAEIASEAKSRFLATMSHELRTPLNAIIGFAELLLMRDVEQMEQRRGYIADVRNSGGHLLALINDILDYSKVEADHLSLSETVFDLGRFLHDSVRLVRPPASRCRRRRRSRLRATSGACSRAWSTCWPTRLSSRRAVRSQCRRRWPTRPASRSGSPTAAAASRPTSSNGCSSPFHQVENELSRATNGLLLSCKLGSGPKSSGKRQRQLPKALISFRDCAICVLISLCYNTAISLRIRSCSFIPPRPR